MAIPYDMLALELEVRPQVVSGDRIPNRLKHTTRGPGAGFQMRLKQGEACMGGQILSTGGGIMSGGIVTQRLKLSVYFGQ